MKYRISEKAINDLENIWFYTFNRWSKEQADRYHHLIIQEIEYVVDNFNLCQNKDYIRLGYRMTKVKSHLIFLKQADDVIEIIRILHENMDIENRLMKNE
jgi:toxin ParE1/3/4